MLHPVGTGPLGLSETNIIIMYEIMEQWLQEHPDATAADAFKAGWFACTDAWCHGKREKLEQVVEHLKDIIS